MTRQAVVSFLAWSVLVPGLLPAQKKPVTLEALNAGGMRMMDFAGAPVWAPDGKHYAYREGSKLMLYDAAAKTSKEILSGDPTSAAAVKFPAPERMDWENRRASEDRLQWFPDGKSLLLLSGGDIFVWHLDGSKFDQLTATPVQERDPKISPDGTKVSFRRGSELFVVDVASKKETQLTHDSTETIFNAQLDWVYPEELNLGTAHWWSPDSKHIAYLQFDVSREMFYPHADLLGLRAKAEPQRYPQAGTPNADVRLAVVAVTGGSPRWMDLGENRDQLIARVAWTPDSRMVVAQKLNRVQTRLDLLAADIETGTSRLLLRESDAAWVNVRDMLRFLPRTNQFLWSSERDGFNHLYLYSMEGKLVRQITKGDWEVSSLSCVDESAGTIYYSGSQQSPLERHLYRVGLDGKGLTRLTQTEGTHMISMSPTCDYYVDTSSSLTQPSRRTLNTNDGKEWTVLREADRKVAEEYNILPTEIVKVKADDGTILYARLIRPANFRPDFRYPAIVQIYGGPGVGGAIRNSWSGLSWDQVLAHKGFVIWQLDNRGTGGRGHAFESKISHRLGETELKDQVTGVKHLISMGFVDPKRVGINGWSYGGYMTLYALLNAPDVFAAGIAGAPVTDWHNYDTIYTERYLGLPSDNPEGYKASSPVTYAGKLTGKLLMLHNIDDDNVLFQNSMQMMNAFQLAGKQYQSLVYPQKSHGVGGPAARQMRVAMTEFFEQTLLLKQ